MNSIISFACRKRLALRTTLYTSATKVAMAFHNPFWEREHGRDMKGGSTLTDLHIKQVYYPQKSKDIYICDSDDVLRNLYKIKDFLLY
jgi:monoamine oxidase